MKVAVTAENASWDAPVDPRFGRAMAFLIVDTESRTMELIDNAAGRDAVQGAGIQAATAICRAGAEALLTGHCGPKAFSALAAGGVTVYTGVAGTVAEAVERLQRGELAAAAASDVAGHWA
ncbi:MAG TPA: NifB/NifX family molybdenum-iron cluster-binding protein [Candidatus Sulfomarinibacteraceae bacterium]|nr:NifB/NifX family molybdenum-iron cluster-binding protein [Candidatus Sulfomarinibacteraceae bacterium]